MKIIKRGKPESEKIYEVSCDHCKTRFEFNRPEAEYISDQRDGDYLRIACPVCKRNVTLGIGGYGTPTWIEK